jgi:hypothetical protein
MGNSKGRQTDKNPHSGFENAVIPLFDNSLNYPKGISTCSMVGDLYVYMACITVAHLSGLNMCHAHDKNGKNEKLLIANFGAPNPEKCARSRSEFCWNFDRISLKLC